jgi:uncharacterized PurR-regulated membrane protein YhhQ (DUF165 family)
MHVDGDGLGYSEPWQPDLEPRRAPLEHDPKTPTDWSFLIIAFALTYTFVITIIAANWLTSRYGFVSVGFGLTATAGTYAAGLTFGLRDALHEHGGRWCVLALIIVGGVLSYAIAPSLAVASAAAFIISEVADLVVYDPLRRRRWIAAVIASNLVGALVDTIVFLQLAGFPIQSALAGQMVGKALMILPALALVGLLRRRRQ